MDIWDMSKSIVNGDGWGALAAAGSLLYDGATTMVPGLPAGAGAARRGAKAAHDLRKAEKVADLARGPSKISKISDECTISRRLSYPIVTTTHAATSAWRQ